MMHKRTNIGWASKKLLMYFVIPYVCIISIILVFDIINYRSTMLTIKNQTINSTYSNLKVNLDKVNTNLTKINDATIQFNSDQSIINAAENPNLDLLDAKDLQKKLRAYNGVSPLIDEILLYLPKSGIAVSNSKAFYMDNKRDAITCDSLTYEEFKNNYLETNYTHSLVTLKNFRYLSDEVHDTLCIISSLPIGEDAVNAQLLFLLNDQELENIISDLGHPHAFVNIINDKKYLLPESQAFPAELFDDIHGCKVKKKNGEKLFLFRLETERAPFDIVAAISNSEIMREVNSQRHSIYLILIVSFSFALLLAALFAIRHAKSTKTIIDEKEKLATQFENNKPYIINAFFKSLFLNEIPSTSDIDSIIKELDIPLSNRGNYAVLLIHDEFDCPDMNQYTKDLFLHKFIIQNVIGDIVPDAVPFEVSFDSISFILPFNSISEDLCQKKIELIFDTIDNVLMQEVNYNLEYACGTVTDSLDKISLSFFDAQNQLIAQRSLVSTVQGNSAQDVYYPLELEVSLINAVSTGISKSVCSIFTLIENSNNKFLHHPQLCSYLAGTLRRVVNEKKALIPASISDGFNYQAADLEEYKKMFIQICEYTSTNTSPLFRKIMQYIDNNYSNIQLSRTNVANEFHITEEYVSVLFKRYKNSTFLNYVDNARVTRAQTLLRESRNMSLEQIAYQCGYSNVISFRRAFKKITNTVPSEYRKQ